MIANLTSIDLGVWNWLCVMVSEGYSLPIGLNRNCWKRFGMPNNGLWSKAISLPIGLNRNCWKPVGVNSIRPYFCDRSNYQPR